MVIDGKGDEQNLLYSHFRSRLLNVLFFFFKVPDTKEIFAAVKARPFPWDGQSLTIVVAKVKE